MRVAVLNGPNLNLLGIREPEVYGTTALSDIEQMICTRAESRNVEVSWHQTNHEGEFVDLVQGLSDTADGALINAAALTHTSLAVRDALLATQVPFVEVHLSNIFAREAERRKSLFADLAVGIIAGFGENSYMLGLDAMINHLEACDG